MAHKTKFFLLLVFLLVGCSSPTAINQTQQPSTQPPTVTPPLVPSRIVTLSNNTLLPRTPTPSLVVIEPAGPKVTLKGDGVVNLRGGPGTLYSIVGRVTTGTTFVALSRSEHGEWLLLAYPDTPGGKAWVYAAYTDYNPSLHLLPVAIAPQPGASLQEPAIVTPTFPNNSTPPSAIEILRASLDLPKSPLFLVETTDMINSPTGRLKVEIYQDREGRKYSYDPVTNRVVEIDARSLLNSLPNDAPTLTEEELKLRAAKIFQATVPDVLSRQLSLQYEEGGKVDNYFYTWRGQLTPGSMNPPFAQIGLHKSGFLFADFNTLQVNK